MRIQLDRKNILIGAAAAVIFGLLLWVAFRPAAVKVEAGQAAMSPLTVTIDAEGRTRVKNKFTVTAPVAGKMLRINLSEGDNVPRNYLITEIDPSPPIPRSPDEANIQINPYAAKVYAPASGKILRVFEKSERYLQAGTPLVEIGLPGDIEIVIDVLSTDAVQVRPGATVYIDDAEGEPLSARVRTIEPQAETKVSALGVEEKRVNVIADLANRKTEYGDNFRVDAHIMVWQADNVLTVPNSALFRVGEGWNVYVLDGSRARLRKVETGHRSGTATEILGGLEEGEWVVLHPPSALADGSRVTID